MMQNPELPTGCEVTAAAMLLAAYGYRADKLMLASYLTKSDRIDMNGKVYAYHPNERFIGNPETLCSYGVFPRPLADAMQKVIEEQGGNDKVYSLYGMPEEKILTLIDKGIPVCVWTSMYNLEIEYRKGWFLIRDDNYTDEYFYWPSNEHVVVLTAYDEENVTVCDPLKGMCLYPRGDFFRHYEQVGGYAIVLGTGEI